MAETYLNGKITVTSLAAPTIEDMEKIRALDESERKAMLAEALERGRNSPVTDKTIDDAFESALKRFEETKEETRPHHAADHSH